MRSVNFNGTMAELKEMVDRGEVDMKAALAMMPVAIMPMELHGEDDPHSQALIWALQNTIGRAWKEHGWGDGTFFGGGVRGRHFRVRLSVGRPTGSAGVNSEVGFDGDLAEWPEVHGWHIIYHDDDTVNPEWGQKFDALRMSSVRDAARDFDDFVKRHGV